MGEAIPRATAAGEAQPVRRKQTLSLTRSQTRLAWVMLAPTLLVVAFVALWPLIQTFVQSFTNARLNSFTPTKYVGFDNYATLFSDTDFLHSIWVTVQFTIITIVFEFVLGLIIAMVINSNFKGRGLMRAAMLIPWAIPTVVSAMMWRYMYNGTYGVVTDVLHRIGLLSPGTDLVADPTTSLPAIAAVDIWKTTPFVSLLLLAGLQVIPIDLYEAAKVDGTNAWQQFWQITLPLLRPAILVTLIFRTLDALRVFDVFYVMFANRRDTQTMAVYDQLQTVNFSKLGFGAAVSTAIFFIIAIFVVIYVTFLRVEEQ